MTLVVLLAVGAWVYAYVGYPALLLVAARRRRPRAEPPTTQPRITIVLPVHNEAHRLARALQGVVALDYPADRREIFVVSDGSTDDTVAVARSFAALGVEVIALPRVGKTAAEAAAGVRARGDIIVIMDAASRVPPHAIAELVRPFDDPTVGVVSGTDVSTGGSEDPGAGEGTYVSYEMWLRGLETRVGGIIGASGCFYAVRTWLCRLPLRPDLSRDFAAALLARQMGYRAVTAPRAICLVHRTPTVRDEYRRKVRTMSRGLATLWHKRRLLNPARYGVFAWMLWSHKLCRWILPWTVVAVLLAAAVTGTGALAGATLVAAPVALLTAGMVWLGAGRWRFTRWRPVAAAGYLVLGLIAGLHAWGRALSGRASPVWAPTRRPV